MIASLLRANDIRCSESASLPPVLGLGTGGGVTIHVLASDLERAQALAPMRAQLVNLGLVDYRETLGAAARAGR